MQKKKHGISLIVLVITIIVMIILASAIVISLTNSGILKNAEDAVQKTNQSEIQQLATIGYIEAYADGKRTQKELKEATMEYLRSNGVKEEILDQYAVDVTLEGVGVYYFPDDWKESVSTIVNGVPIPYGFVASPYDGENKKEDGLVIYELQGDETEILATEGHSASLTGRNQYVWIPVDDFSKFVRRKGSNVLGTGTWEIALDTTLNMPLSVQEKTFVSDTTRNEVIEMYESVAKYGGYYIARYEAGLVKARTSSGEAIVKGADVYSRMHAYPYTHIQWATSNAMNNDKGGMVEVARSVYNNTSTVDNHYVCGVKSTLIYAVQWDTAVEWFNTSGAITIANNVVKDAVNYGNYNKRVITAGELNDGASYAVLDGTLGEYGKINIENVADSTEMKASGTVWSLTTGALKTSKMKNIYDMAGNVWEYSMEGYGSAGGRNPLGGGASNSTTYDLLSHISTYFLQTTAPWDNGFRVSLYIK